MMIQRSQTTQDRLIAKRSRPSSKPRFSITPLIKLEWSWLASFKFDQGHARAIFASLIFAGNDIIQWGMCIRLPTT